MEVTRAADHDDVENYLHTYTLNTLNLFAVNHETGPSPSMAIIIVGNYVMSLTDHNLMCFMVQLEPTQEEQLEYKLAR